MAKTAAEIKDMAEEVVADSLEIVEGIEKKNNSFFRRSSKPEIFYMIDVIRQLSNIVLNLATTAAKAEALIALKDEAIEDLFRDNLEVRVKLAQSREETPETEKN
jgi:hypothetical protein